MGKRRFVRTRRNLPPSAPVSPHQTEEHLAEEVRNPLAALTQIQFSNDFDFGAAVDSGFLYTFTLQPIISFTIVTLF